MVETDYLLHPLGRKIMLALLGVSFILFFAIAPYIVLPVNLVLIQFTTFQIIPGIFVRGVVGVLFGILFTALLLELLFSKLGWYYFEFDEDRYLDLYYRSTIFGSPHHLQFNLRDTMITYVDRLIWIVSADPKNMYSIMMFPPPEKAESTAFYDSFDQQVEENFYKAKKRVEPLNLSDYGSHFLFSSGKIRKLSPRQFELLTGVSSFYNREESKDDIYMEEEKQDRDDVEYIDEEENDRADYYEYNQIMNEAETVSKIE